MVLLSQLTRKRIPQRRYTLRWSPRRRDRVGVDFVALERTNRMLDRSACQPRQCLHLLERTVIGSRVASVWRSVIPKSKGIHENVLRGR